MKSVKELNLDQLSLDYDEAQAQLRRIGQAAELVEQLRAQLAAAQREVKRIKRDLETAGWNVVAISKSILDRERRRAKG